MFTTGFLPFAWLFSFILKCNSFISCISMAIIRKTFQLFPTKYNYDFESIKLTTQNSSKMLSCENYGNFACFAFSLGSIFLYDYRENIFRLLLCPNKASLTWSELVMWPVRHVMRVSAALSQYFSTLKCLKNHSVIEGDVLLGPAASKMLCGLIDLQ